MLRLAGPCQIYTSVSVRVPFIPNAAYQFEIPLREDTSEEIAFLSVLYDNIVAGRQELSVGCPKKFISDCALCSCLYIFCAVVDINHSSPAPLHLPKFSTPPMHPHFRLQVLYIHYERKQLLLNIPHVPVFFIHGLCIVALFVMQSSLILPQMCLTCGGPFLVDWL